MKLTIFSVSPACTEVMVFTILLIVVFVQVFQFTGNAIVRKLDKRL